MVALMGHMMHTGTPLRAPTATVHGTNTSATMATGAGSSSRSRRSSNGGAILVYTASTKPTMSLARPCSEGMTSGGPSRPSHSSVTTTVADTAASRAARRRHRFTMAFTWPRPGYGTATMWHGGAATEPIVACRGLAS
nr:unnamed protein product [Digitaria exilis]